MRMQRHEDAEAGQQRDHGSAPVADQRQGHADHRQDAARHAGVDEHIDEEAQCDGASGQARKSVLALHGQIQRASDHDAVQRQNEQLAQQAELLADDGEDEIGGPFRQEFKLRLAAVHIALAETPARADRDLRLDDVVSGAQRVVFGIEEGQYALPLVIVDEMPGRPDGASQHGDGYQYDPQLQAGEQHHDEAGGGDQQGRAEVRLLGDHRGGYGDQDAHDEQVFEGRRQGALVHVPGAYHRDRQLHDLGRLEAHESHVQPALRALADVAGHLDHDEQQHADDVGDGSEQAQVLRCRQTRESQHGG